MSMTDEREKIESPYPNLFIKNIAPSHFVIAGNENRTLLKLNMDGTVEADLDDCDEAARLFIKYIMQRWGAFASRPSDRDSAIEECAKVAEAFWDNSLTMVPPMQQKIAAAIRTLATPEQEKEHK